MRTAVGIEVDALIASGMTRVLDAIFSRQLDRQADVSEVCEFLPGKMAYKVLLMIPIGMGKNWIFRA